MTTITKLPPGYAHGITQIERILGTQFSTNFWGDNPHNPTTLSNTRGTKMKTLTVLFENTTKPYSYLYDGDVPVTPGTHAVVKPSNEL